MYYIISMFAVTILLLQCLLQVYAAELNSTCPSEFAGAIRSGLWECAKHIAEQSEIDLRNILDLETRGIVKELADIKKHLESTLPMDEINPAYQWAQSPDEIFLSVKFAHKLDTPGTLNVVAKNVTITDNFLYLFASDGRKNFKLSIDFLKDINPDESTWSMASVGRMSFNIKKKTLQSNWARLMKDRKKTPNQHFWIEMHEKYANLLSKLDDDADELKPKSTSNPKPPPIAKLAEEKNIVEPSVTISENNPAVEVVTNTPANESKETQELLKLEVDYKAAVAQLESEAKAKRKEIDVRSKLEKQTIDKDLVEKKRLALEKYQLDKDQMKLNVQNNYKDSNTFKDA